MNSAVPTIRTARLTLPPLEPEHALALHEIYQHEGVLRYFPNPAAPPLERVHKFITAQQKHWEQHGYGNWGVLPDGEERIAGWVGLQWVPERNEAEVGFLLDRPHWGKGYATEAALASLRYGFDQHGLDHIIALVHPENMASRHVIEKCGMIYAETISLWGIQLRRYCLDCAPEGG